MSSQVSHPQFPSKLSPDKDYESLTSAIGLCLSGGGYRAMLFHIGALIRLNELGLLRHVHRVSSVSGGSITAAQLALVWKDLWPNDDSEVVASRKAIFTYLVKPLVQVGEGNLLSGWQVPHVLGSQMWGGFRSILPNFLKAGTSQWGTAEVMTQGIEKKLFNGAKTLADLPIPANMLSLKAPVQVSSSPEFYINATNLKTGNLFIFCRRYAGESELGYLHYPHQMSLARAVVASSGFPPFISPVGIDVAGVIKIKLTTKLSEQETSALLKDLAEWHDSSHPSVAAALDANEEAYAEHIMSKPPSESPDPDEKRAVAQDLFDDGCGLSKEAVAEARKSSSLSLGDGGIYDNLGLEPVIRKFQCVLVSDAGQSISYDENPSADYAVHAKNTLELIDHQVRVLRKRQLTRAYTAREYWRRDGVYWSIRGDVAKEWKPKAGKTKQHTDGSDSTPRGSTNTKAVYDGVLGEDREHPSMKKLAELALQYTDYNTKVKPLAAITTGLWSLEKEVWDLINWGYVRTASAMANFYEHSATLNQGFSYLKTAQVELPSVQKENLDVAQEQPPYYRSSPGGAASSASSRKP